MELFLKLIPHITSIALSLIIISLIRQLGIANGRISQLERGFLLLEQVNRYEAIQREGWEKLAKYNKIIGDDE